MKTAMPQVIPLQLDRSSHDCARKFAAEESVPEKAKQVYLNTLAVCASRSYLEWMEFKTDLSESESWHPVARHFHNVADLLLPGLGRLECRPVWFGETVLSLPPEVTEDRIGCLAVQFKNEKQLDKVKLLGFYRALEDRELPETIAIADLQTCEEMIEYLEELEVAAMSYSTSSPETLASSPSKVAVNLSQWLRGIFEEGWQTAATLFELQIAKPAFEFRSADSSGEREPPSVEAGTKRGKEIDLGIPGGNVFLLVEIKPESEHKMRVHLQVYPADEVHLTPNLQLILLDESGKAITNTLSRETDNYIQLQFHGVPAERFGVRVALGEASITEDFII
ncbi:MAG: DUF1822 family protein [Oscillatoria sp. SIO1A7]|nr:DUF1822 family protein [Oscillatoria sp. SIO1A7]